MSDSQNGPVQIPFLIGSSGSLAVGRTAASLHPHALGGLGFSTLIAGMWPSSHLSDSSSSLGAEGRGLLVPPPSRHLLGPLP